MPCRVIRVNGLTGIVCGGPRAKKCHYCAVPSTVLCDHPVGIGKTCDRPCCKTHSECVGPNRDYCLKHAEFERKKKADAERVANQMEVAGMFPCRICSDQAREKNGLCDGCEDARLEAWDQDHPEERCPQRE